MSKYKLKITKKYHGGLHLPVHNPKVSDEDMLRGLPILDASRMSTDAEKKIAEQLQFDFKQQMEQDNE